MFGLLAFALSTAAVIIGFTQAKDFVARRLRYVDAVRSPLAPVVAGIGAALIAAPIVWLLPIVGAGSAIAFGLSVALGVADDLSARKFLRVFGVTDGAQRCGVQDRAVIEMQDKHRRIGRDRIDLFQRR